MLVLVDEEGVVLIVMDYVRDGGKCEVADRILAVRSRINVEVFTTVYREEVQWYSHGCDGLHVYMYIDT